MAENSPTKAQVSIVTRSGVGEDIQPEEVQQEETTEIKEEAI